MQNEDEITITISTLEELKESLEDEITTIIIQKDSNIELNESISITKNDTTITGEINNNSENNEKPIITCKDANGHILISGYNVKITNIEIKDCLGGPVIRIESIDYDENIDDDDDDDDEDIDYKITELSNLDFKANNESEDNNNDFSGGALYIGEGNSVTIINSTFKDNWAVQGAGIYWTLPSELIIENSVFENNKAEIAGAAIYTFPGSKIGSIEIKNCNFKNNQYTDIPNSDGKGCLDKNFFSIEPVNVYDEYSSLCPTKGGGALFLENVDEVDIQESNFEYNYGTNVAGAIFLRDVQNTYISNCNFTSNVLTSVDISHGGAIYVLNEDSDSGFYIAHSTFFNNTAVHGGAIHFLATKGKLYGIENTDFNQNIASATGGAIVVRNKNIDSLGNRFNGNKAITGGAIMFANDAVSNFYTGLAEDPKNAFNYFNGNYAADGGAIASIGASNIIMVNGYMNNNAAGYSGGSLYILESSISGLIELRNFTFDNNIALKGGAIFVQSVTAMEIEDNSRFTNNKAISGGALYISVVHSYKDKIKLQDLTFENNSVKTSIENLTFPDEVLGYLDDVNISTNTEDSTDNSNILLSKYSNDPCFPGGGGAICLQIYDSQDAHELDVKLSNLFFQNNSGYVGGAAMLATRNEVRDNCEDEECYYIQISDSEFYENEASGAGGAIFAFSPEYILDSTTGCNLIEKDVSLKFENNRVIDGGYGEDVASGIAKLKTMDLDQASLVNINSNDNEIKVKIAIYDFYDQQIVKAVEYAEQVVNVRSDGSGNGTGLSGTIDVKAINGISNFVLIYDAIPGEYPLEFNVDDYGINYTIYIEIRDCYIGESRVKETECLLCEGDVYSFNPDFPYCSSCPKNSICDGSYLLFPKLDYWHSSPFSPLMHRCLYKDACDFDNRISALTNIKNKYVNNTNPDFFQFDGYLEAECNKGYTGILCASCTEGYAHKINGECIKCDKNAYTSFLVFLYFLWTFILLSATVRSALTTLRDISILGDLAVEKKLRRDRSRSSYAVSNPNSSFISHPSAESSEMVVRETDEITVMVDPNAKIDTINEDEIYPDESGESSKRDQRNQIKRPPPLEVFSNNSSRRLRKKIIKAKIEKIFTAEKLSELIKIFVNFLKVTSVSIYVNIKWTEILKRILLLQDSMSGFTGSSSLSPIECYISDNPHDSVYYGTIFRIFYPLMISAFLMGIFFIYWIILRFVNKTHLSHLIRRIVVVAVVTLFFSYDSVTSYLLRIINCIKIDTEDNYDDSFNDNDYAYFQKYSIANQTYWVEDPAFICYQGKHSILMYFLGITGLLLFSLGVPVGLAIALIYLKYRNKLEERSIINKIGFVYQGYTDQFIYWEIIILIRKALVQVIVVFAYPLKENLQCVMLLGILICAIILHIIAWPFDYLILNLFETLSLSISILTFYFGLIFNDDRTPDTIIIILSLVLVFAIIAFFIIFIVCVIQAVNNLMIAYIQAEGKDVPDNFFKRTTEFINVTLASGSGKLITFATIIKSNLSPKPKKTIPTRNNDMDNALTTHMAPIN